MQYMLKFPRCSYCYELWNAKSKYLTNLIILIILKPKHLSNLKILIILKSIHLSNLNLYVFLYFLRSAELILNDSDMKARPGEALRSMAIRVWLIASLIAAMLLGVTTV